MIERETGVTGLTGEMVLLLVGVLSFVPTPSLVQHACTRRGSAFAALQPDSSDSSDSCDAALGWCTTKTGLKVTLLELSTACTTPAPLPRSLLTPRFELHRRSTLTKSWDWARSHSGRR